MQWSTTTAPARRRYDDVWFFNRDVGVAVNSSGEIRKTTDGGLSWPITFPKPTDPSLSSAVYLRCLAFADETKGWVGTLTPTHRLFKTTNSGEDWLEVVNLPAGAPSKICGLYAVNAKVIYGSGTNDPGDPPAIIKSINGGDNWSAIDMSEYASSLIDIYFTDENRGWVVGGITPNPNPTYDNVRPVILRTEDGGVSWVDTLENMRGQFDEGTWGWKIQFLTDTLGFVSLESFSKALILKTTDGGDTWERIDVTDNANLEGIGFLDEQEGWVGGWGDETFSSGTTSKTNSGGVSWENADDIGKFINRFRFYGDPIEFGYASGSTIYKYSEDAEGAVLAQSHESRLIVVADKDTYGGPSVPIVVRVPSGAKRMSIQIWNRFGAETRAYTSDTPPTPGEHIIDWDKKDENGNVVRPGAYIYRVTIDDEADSNVLFIR